MIPAGYAKRVPAGSTLSFSMHYTTNATAGKDRTNPDPAATVHYGDQTWDEMIPGYFTYTIDGQTKAATAGRQ